MSRTLPARPNLEYLRKEAKDLLAAFRRGDPAALPVVRHLRFLEAIPDAELLTPGRMTLGLQHLQFALALEYGCRDWADLSARAGAGQPPAFTDPEQLAGLPNLTLQVLLRDWDDATVAATAGAGSSSLRDAIFRNLTDRHRARLTATPAFTSPDAAAIAAARATVLATANTLVVRGDIAPPGEPAASADDRATLDARAREMFTGHAGDAPVSRRTTADLVPVFVALGRVARATGLLTLDRLADEYLDEPLIRRGARGIADGEEMATLQTALESDRDAALAACDRRQTLVMTAVVRLCAGALEGMTEALAALPASDGPGVSVSVVSAAGAPRDALDRELAGEPASRRTTAGLIPLFAAMADRAAREGLLGLDGMPARIDDDLLRSGLQPAVDGSDTGFVREILTARAKRLRSALEQRLDMTVAAVAWIAIGVHPGLIETRCRAML